MNNRITVSFSIPQSLKEAIETFAQRTKRTQSAVVEMAFENFLGNQEVKEVISASPSESTQNQQ